MKTMYRLLGPIFADVLVTMQGQAQSQAESQAQSESQAPPR
jgi:hypothetical protein